MLLRDCKFIVSSYELRFAAFSDQPYRAVHLKNVRFDTPGSSERVDWYEIQPAAAARWVVVEETAGFDKSRLRFFLGTEFEEHQRSEVSTALLGEICRRIPPRHNPQQCKARQRLAATVAPHIKVSAHLSVGWTSTKAAR